MNLSQLPAIPEEALIQIPVLQRKFTVVNYVYLVEDEDNYFAPVPGEEKTLEHDHLTALLAEKLPPGFGQSNGSVAIATLLEEIPHFYLEEENWRNARHGFWFLDPFALRGKINERIYLLAVNPKNKIYLWQDGRVEFLLKHDHSFHSGIELKDLANQEIIDMGPYYLMRTLLDGIVSDKKLHRRLTRRM